MKFISNQLRAYYSALFEVYLEILRYENQSSDEHSSLDNDKTESVLSSSL